MNLETLSTELKTFLGERIAAEKTSLQRNIDGLGNDHRGLKTALENQMKRIDAMESLLNRSDLSQLSEGKSLATQIFESDALKSYRARGHHQGSFVVGVKSLWGGLEHKTTIDSTAVGSSTPGILVPERIPGIKFAAARRIRVRDLIPSIPTSNNAVEFVKENAFTNAAYPQVEDQNKGESALTFNIASAPVRTIAHWIPASAQVLADFGELQGAINYKLLVGLRDVEDYELLRGDGSGQHIEGLIPQATAFDTTKQIAGDTYIDTLSEAMEQLEQSNRDATGFVINSGDWRKITRVKTNVTSNNQGSYVLGGPGVVAEPTLWGKPVALCNAMPAGKFLVGDFVSGAIVADREDARVDVSSQHSDFFVKNLVAVRCEERLALAVFRSDYFIYGSF